MTNRIPTYQTAILNSALNHLDPKSEHFQGSDVVRAALLDPALRNYLQSWVIPQLWALRDDDVPKWMRDGLKGDRASRHYEPKEA